LKARLVPFAGTLARLQQNLLHQSVIESALLVGMALPERAFCIAQDDSGKVFPVVKQRRPSRHRLLDRAI
jgi:hypothetical protein